MIRNTMRLIYKNFREYYAIYQNRKNEIYKFQNPERKKIYCTIKLTKEQKRQIDEVYSDNYGKKIPYIWHRYFTAYTGTFDEKYFPELLYIPEFEYYMTPHKEYCYALGDKNVISIIAGYIGVKTPKVILSKAAGIYRDENLRKLSKQQVFERCNSGGVLFAKPSVESSSGRGCQLIEIVKGIDVRTGCSLEQILAGLGEDFVIQDIVKCHPGVRKFHPYSVNTFRVITYRWKESIQFCPIIMRMGTGKSYLDNAHAGGLFIAVENDGKLHKTAFTEFNEQFTEHPDTHIRFEGYKIEGFNKIMEAAKKMHYAVPQVGAINWDFTLDEDAEAVLIEANMQSGSIWLPEMAHGKGAFGDNTEDILRWLRLMRTTKMNERRNLYYGRTGRENPYGSYSGI